MAIVALLVDRAGGEGDLAIPTSEKSAVFFLVL